MKLESLRIKALRIADPCYSWFLLFPVRKKTSSQTLLLTDQMADNFTKRGARSL